MKLWEKYHFDVIFIGDDWKGNERWNNFEKVLVRSRRFLLVSSVYNGISQRNQQQLGEI